MQLRIDHDSFVATVRQRTEMRADMAHPACIQSDHNRAASLQTHETAMKIPTSASPHSIRHTLAVPLGVAMLAVLGACSSVSAITRERVAQGESSVQQAQQTVGQSEHGAMQLQQAKEKIAAAKSAVANGQDEAAQRWTEQARLYAELAVAESQSAAARQSADEVMAGLETLRRETQRTSPTTP